jgi:hypothetical protein
MGFVGCRNIGLNEVGSKVRLRPLTHSCRRAVSAARAIAYADSDAVIVTTLACGRYRAVRDTVAGGMPCR